MVERSDLSLIYMVISLTLKESILPFLRVFFLESIHVFDIKIFFDVDKTLVLATLFGENRLHKNFSDKACFGRKFCEMGFPRKLFLQASVARPARGLKLLFRLFGAGIFPQVISIG